MLSWMANSKLNEDGRSSGESSESISKEKFELPIFLIVRKVIKRRILRVENDLNNLTYPTTDLGDFLWRENQYEMIE